MKRHQAGLSWRLPPCCAGARRVRRRSAYPSRLITIVVPITAGHHHRHPGAALRRQAGEAVRPAGGGREPSGCRRPDRARRRWRPHRPTATPILFANSGHAILGTLNKNLPFDPVGDFAGVTLVGEAPTVVTVAPSLGVRNLKEFVELAKAEARLDQLRLRRHRHRHAPGRRLLRAADRYRPRACSLYGELDHHRRPDRRAHPGHVRADRVRAAAAAGRPVAGAGGCRRRSRSASPSRCRPRSRRAIDYQNATWYGLLAPGKTPPAGAQGAARGDRRSEQGSRACRRRSAFRESIRRASGSTRSMRTSAATWRDSRHCCSRSVRCVKPARS